MPAARSSTAARSIAQPFTMPPGSKPPGTAHASNQPSVATRSAAHRRTTSARGGGYPAGVSSPRRTRLTSERCRYGLNAASTARSSATAPASASPIVRRDRSPGAARQNAKVVAPTCTVCRAIVRSPNPLPNLVDRVTMTPPRDIRTFTLGARDDRGLAVPCQLAGNLRRGPLHGGGKQDELFGWLAAPQARDGEPGIVGQRAAQPVAAGGLDRGPVGEQLPGDRAAQDPVRAHGEPPAADAHEHPTPGPPPYDPPHRRQPHAGRPPYPQP